MRPHDDAAPGAMAAGSDAKDGHPLGVPVARAGPLTDVLVEGRARGLIGRLDLAEQIRHSTGFVGALPDEGRLLDLGAGNGLPGLVIACIRDEWRVTLLESAARRCRFLEWAVEELDLGGRVTVVHGRAEVVAREDEHREGYAAVVSRSFGPPSVTAECARGFLVDGGVLVVSDPPDGDSRWGDAGLAALGFRVERSYRSGGGSFTVLRAVGVCREEIPRRVGLPQKRPLF